MTRIKVAISKEDKVKIEEITLNKEWEDVSISDFNSLITCGGSVCGFYKAED